MMGPMSQHDSPSVTRRAALATGLAGATSAALGEIGCAAPGASAGDDATATRPEGRMPVVFVPHGGGPWPFVDLGMDPVELGALADYLRALPAAPRARPKALLVVSAHWEEDVPTVMTSARPPMLYDYYGFPPDSYAITWPAPGDPALAARVSGLLGAAGIEAASDAARGFDHGTFVPLKLAYPEADVPAVQLSLKAGLDASEHLAIGRALAPLRDEGVFIVGSGMSYHNMRGFRDPRQVVVAEAFDEWLRDTMTLEPSARDERLRAWSSAPRAREAHPREEHLLPLMVAAGASCGSGTRDYGELVLDGAVSAFRFG